MTIYWRPHHEIYPELPPEQDFIVYDEETGQSIGCVYLMTHSEHAGRWHWSMSSSHQSHIPHSGY